MSRKTRLLASVPRRDARPGDDDVVMLRHGLEVTRFSAGVVMASMRPVVIED